MPVISLQNLKKIYQLGDNTVNALRGVSLDDFYFAINDAKPSLIRTRKARAGKFRRTCKS